MTYEFEVEGVECLDCAREIERVIKGLPGVSEARLSFETGRLKVEAGDGFNPFSVVEKMDSLGYRAREVGLMRTSFFVEGMDCQDEVRIIERKLKALRGVVDYRADPLQGTLEVLYDPSLLSQRDIVRSIAETGMRPRVERKAREEVEPWWKDRKILFLVACGVLTLVAFILHRAGLPERITVLFYLLAVVVGIYYPAKMGLASVKTFTLNIYTLLVVAVAGALGLALWEEAAVLVFVYSLGAVLETYSTSKARKALIALMELAPREAMVKRDGEEIRIPVEEVKIGDIVVIRPGEKVPLDGVVVGGYSSIDESPITGESIPVEKKEGDQVFAGSVNRTGSLEIRVTKPSTDTTLARIIHSVEEAQARKSRYQRFGERFGRYYTPLTFALALLVATVPPLFFDQPFSVWFYRSLVLLVVSCSCGLALSVPVAVVSAISNAARQGILIKGGAYLEAASGLDVIAFDKTGTLTLGSPKVCDVVALNGREEEILRMAASIEARSEHHLGEAIVREAKERGLTLEEVRDFQALPGKGVKATVDGETYIIGSERLFREDALSEEVRSRMEALREEGKTTVLFGREDEVLGIIAVRDQVRPQAKEAVERLKEMGYRIAMLTGDNPTTARAVAMELGIEDYRAGLLPEDKIRIVKEIKEGLGKVAFVGDGVNDAPAMAEADIGIAMGACGTDVAIETGDIVLMSDDLLKVPFVFELSKRSIRNIKQNIVASLAIVAFLVPAALAGAIGLVPGLLINESSAIVVISNGLRLLR